MAGFLEHVGNPDSDELVALQLRLQPLQVEKVADQVVEALGFFVNRLQIIPALFRADLVVQHEFDKTEHGGEGGAHFVADRGEHLVLEPLQLALLGIVLGDVDPSPHPTLIIQQGIDKDLEIALALGLEHLAGLGFAGLEHAIEGAVVFGPLQPAEDLAAARPAMQGRSG